MKKSARYFIAFVFCLLFLTSCVTWQKLFTQYETFEVKYAEMSVDVKMPSEIPTEYIKKEASQFISVIGGFFAIRYAFEDTHVYNFIDFLMKYEEDEFKICAIVSWTMLNKPEPEAWFYVDGFPFPSTVKEVLKFLRGE